jgi:hypothetical protein
MINVPSRAANDSLVTSRTGTLGNGSHLVRFADGGVQKNRVGHEDAGGRGRDRGHVRPDDAQDYF